MGHQHTHTRIHTDTQAHSLASASKVLEKLQTHTHAYIHTLASASESKVLEELRGRRPLPPTYPGSPAARTGCAVLGLCVCACVVVYVCVCVCPPHIQAALLHAQAALCWACERVCVCVCVCRTRISCTALGPGVHMSLHRASVHACAYAISYGLPLVALCVPSRPPPIQITSRYTCTQARGKQNATRKI